MTAGRFADRPRIRPTHKAFLTMETVAFPQTAERGIGERVGDWVGRAGRVLWGALSFIGRLLLLPLWIVEEVATRYLTKADWTWITMLAGAVALVAFVPEAYGALTDPVLKCVAACSVLYYIDQKVYHELDTYAELRNTQYGSVALLAVYGWIIAACFGA